MKNGYSLLIVLMFMLLATISVVGVSKTVMSVDRASAAYYHSEISNVNSNSLQNITIARLENEEYKAIRIAKTIETNNRPVKISDSTYAVGYSYDPLCLQIYTRGVGPFNARTHHVNYYCFENIVTDTSVFKDTQVKTSGRGKLEDAVWVGKTISATASIYTVGSVYVGDQSNTTGSFTVNGEFRTGENWSMTGSMAVYGNYSGPTTLSWPPNYITGSQTIKDTTEEDPISVNPTQEAKNIHSWSNILSTCGAPCLPFSSISINGASLDTAHKYVPSSYFNADFLSIDATGVNFSGGTTRTKSYIRKDDGATGKVPGQLAPGLMVFVSNGTYTNFEVDGKIIGLIFANGPSFSAKTFTIDGAFVSSQNTVVDVVGSLRADLNTTALNTILDLGIIVEGKSHIDSTIIDTLFTTIKTYQLSDFLTSKLVSSIPIILPLDVFDTTICPYSIPKVRTSLDSNIVYNNLFLNYCDGTCTVSDDTLSVNGLRLARRVVGQNGCVDTSYVALGTIPSSSPASSIAPSSTPASSIAPSSSLISSSLAMSSSIPASSIAPSSSVPKSSSAGVSCTPWSPTQHWSTYTLGDKRSDGGKYWKCTNTSWAQSYAPSSSWGYLGWTQIASCS
jgi:Tfp pilus assembly protein PilX